MTTSKIIFDDKNIYFITYLKQKAEKTQVPISYDEKQKCYLSFMIENSSWFFATWKNDPTVESMLNMLNAIHVKFGNVDFSTIWNKLSQPNYTLPNDNIKLNNLMIAIENDKNTSKEVNTLMREIKNELPVSFKFLNLEDFQLSDELYLKMNARGKSLSDFENFKAWLIGWIDELLKIDNEANNQFKKRWCTDLDWKQRMDLSWTDWLWKNKNEKLDLEIIKDVTPFDYAGIHFVKNIAFINYFYNYNEILTEINKEHPGFSEVQIKKIIENSHIKIYDNYLSAKNKEKIQFLESIYKYCFININFCEFLFDSFNKLSEIMNIINNFENIDLWKIDKEKLKKSLLQHSDFKDKSYLFTIIKLHPANQKKDFIKWFRIIRNLIENTEITAVNFHIVLHSITEIISNESLNEVVGFSPTQIKEEELKATLILNNPDWEKEIIECENHPMFKGNIGFLLQEKETSDLNLFIRRKNVAQNLFDKDGVTIGKGGNLLGRVLLSLGLDLQNNYELWLGGISQYWKSHLKDNHYIPIIIKVFDLLDDNNFDKFEEILESTISNNKEKLVFWKQILIENPKLFSDYSLYGRIINNWRGICLYEREKFNLNVNAILISNNRSEVIFNLVNKFNFCDLNIELKCDKFYAGDKIELKIDSVNKTSSLKLIFEKDTVIGREIDNNIQISECVYSFNDEDKPLDKQLEDKYPSYFHEQT